ncbi:hypothetical protein D3C71_1486760 [compost metagenome]
MIARHPAGSQQPVKLQPHNDMVQGGDQLPSEPQLPVFRPDTDVGDVQRVSVLLMIPDIAVIRHRRPGVGLAQGLVIHQQRSDGASQLAVHLDTERTLGKMGDMARKLFLVPPQIARIRRRERFGLDLDQPGKVSLPVIADQGRNRRGAVHGIKGLSVHPYLPPSSNLYTNRFCGRARS